MFFPCCAIINHPMLRTRNSDQLVKKKKKKGLDDDQDEEPRCWIRGPQDTADFVYWCIGSSTKGQESSPLGFPFRLVPASPNARNRNHQHQHLQWQILSSAIICRVWIIRDLFQLPSTECRDAYEVSVRGVRM